MQHKIHGTLMPSLEMLLEPGESVFTQTHQLGWMSDSVRSTTSMSGNNKQGGFLGAVWGAVKRSMTGASFFQNVYHAEGVAGLLAINPRFPGQIIMRELAAGETLVCRKETFLVAESSVTLDLYFRKQLSGGLFGGEGFIMQKVTGPGKVFLDLSGDVVKKTLGAGERLRVHVAHVGVQDESVTFGIELVPGVKNLLFGGNGIFYAVLTGPGDVYLQTMPIAVLAEEIARHIGDPQQPQTGANAAVDVVAGAARLFDDFTSQDR